MPAYVCNWFTLPKPYQWKTNKRYYKTKWDKMNSNNALQIKIMQNEPKQSIANKKM